MITREAIVEASRKYLNTPFRHQGRVLGRGCDCAGLLICVARDIGYVQADFDITNYGRLPTGDDLRRALDANMDQIHDSAAWAAGDVLLMRIVNEPQHVAIITPNDHMIHSYAQLRRVTEHRIDSVWRGRICGAYRFRGLTDE